MGECWIDGMIYIPPFYTSAALISTSNSYIIKISHVLSVVNANHQCRFLILSIIIVRDSPMIVSGTVRHSLLLYNILYITVCFSILVLIDIGHCTLFGYCKHSC